MHDVKASMQLMMDAMEAWLSCHLSRNYKEELDEFCKEMVQNRSIGEERQHKLQWIRGHNKRSSNSFDFRFIRKKSPIFNPLLRNKDNRLLGILILNTILDQSRHQELIFLPFMVQIREISFFITINILV